MLTNGSRCILDIFLKFLFSLLKKLFVFSIVLLTVILLNLIFFYLCQEDNDLKFEKKIVIKPYTYVKVYNLKLSNFHVEWNFCSVWLK